MNNLKFLFQTNSPQTPEPLTILDNRITLFKRSNSNQWQCRFKLDSGAWHTASTHTDQTAEATTKAIEIYEQVRYRVANDLAIKNRNFRSVAVEELESLRGVHRELRSKQTINDYIFVLEKYLIPFFGRYPVREINQHLIDDFDTWRISEMGRVAKFSTQRHHASAFNRVLKRARSSGLLNTFDEPISLNVDGDRGETRPAFSREEIDQLLAFMPEWEIKVRRDRTERFHAMARLCRCYVEFLLYTGIRTGTESMPIRWKNLHWHCIDQKRYLRVWVSGKTGPRYLIARNELIPSLERLVQWQASGEDLDSVIEKRLDRKIFVFPKGDQPYSLNGVFERLMEESGLLEDHTGKKRTLYSLRHTYATFALADGIDIHTLARQMGTSVGMIERHYSKLTPMMSAEKLA